MIGHFSKIFPVICLALTVLLGAQVVYAQLAGADTTPGSSCAGFPDGATRMTADADLDGGTVVLVCDGTTWNAATGGGSSIWLSSGSDIYYSSGNVNIGNNVASDALLYVQPTVVTPATWKGGVYAYDYTWGSTAAYNGTFGIEGNAETAATGAGYTEAYGVIGTAIGTSDAKQQAVIGVLGHTTTHDTDLGYALIAKDKDDSTGGTIYGLYIDLDDTDITRYGIYQFSSNSNYLAGTLGIGDNTPDVALDVVGDINYTGVLVDVSDIRMKYDIEPLDSPLRKLTTLNGFSFKMKDGDEDITEYGVSAQDVQQVFPELVHQVDVDGTLGVSYDGLIAPMIEAIKEQQSIIEAQQGEIDALKGRIEALEH